jgi:hypothetical protein
MQVVAALLPRDAGLTFPADRAINRLSSSLTIPCLGPRGTEKDYVFSIRHSLIALNFSLRES